MATDTQNEVLDGFQKLDHLVYLHRPATTVTHLHHDTPDKLADGRPDPRLIVLCSWMGAAPKHIVKYTQMYQTLFPTAAILLVASSVRDTFASARAQRSRLLTACEAVASFQTARDKTAPTLLHCMSNGGGIAAVRLTELLRQELDLRGPLYSKVVMECMPGRGNVERGVQAVSMSLPKSGLVRWIARWLLRLVMYTMRLVHVVILRREEMMQRLRRQLNEPDLIPVHAPRLYLYSRGDELIDHREVHDHAEQARQRGYANVTEDVFDTAAHCALLPADGLRYRTAIREFWSADG